MDKSTRLENFPISFFAMVMGLSGLTIAWEKAQHLLGVNLHITTALVVVTTLLFTGLVLIYFSKLLRYREAVSKELSHPVKLNFFPTISISFLLLSIAFLPLSSDISRPLWLIGTSLHLLFTLYVANIWIHHEHFEVNHINPAWFIPAVGNVLVPVAGMSHGYTDLSWFFFSIGMLFWVMLMTIIFYRILFHNPIDRKLMPTLFILIAPPAVGFIAYIRLMGELDPFARILYYSGLFLTLLLFTQARRFLKLEFFLSWWAYSFPLAAISIASMVMFEQTADIFYAWVGGGLLFLLTSLVVLLVVRTTKAVIRHRICVAEH
ncbi:MAG: SLAC1 anion channel family protein [Gammaproteobacteria bacterium]|nr:SLAC1 anion channel family protein [Gammaproteobacteria bacterium]